ncbi:PHB depolymerase family esterase [Massilia sp. NR 4-1]|uniref:extracellular catalytic domain type 1 short-chain-length polyhydroxyalkanoate depolymerase n=1 Tax=Massilia sp. NR 4-1 TaxID=1678028 RepID=UPI000B13C0D1|nr:PHB depolymerase family esterase [Massilia sp. NR 4-1]
MKKIALCLALMLAPLHALSQVQSLTHQDVKRKYIVYTPAAYATAPERQFALVLNFAGGGMTAAEQMLYTQMNRTAERHGFIVAYPQGIRNDWNVGFGMPYKEGTDDIGFVRAMLAAMQRDYRIDPRRVYATGLSRGGFFSLRLAAEMPQQFAAVASVGAPLPEPVREHHQQRLPVGVMLVQGTSDSVVSYEGKAGSYLSAPATLDYWLKVNAMDQSPARTRQLQPAAGDPTAASITEHVHGGKRVSLVTIKDGGHTWPGADSFNIGLPIGRTSKALDANELIWEFFRHHSNGAPD